MNKIINKTIKFLNILDNSDLIKDLTYYKEQIEKDDELLKLISVGNNTNNEEELLEIKRKLYNTALYKKYMESYNELFYIVLKINNKYSEFLNERSCHK